MAHVLDGRATLEILFDLGCVFAVESFQFLVELHVALVDVIDVGVLVKCTTATVLASLGDPTQTDNRLYRQIRSQTPGLLSRLATSRPRPSRLKKLE